MARADAARPLLLGLLLAVAVQPASALARSEDEVAIENRLIAPCCWAQTLVNHESRIASALRQEIRERLARGEGRAQIEDELARRYGDRIRAVPRGSDPFRAVTLLTGIAICATALVVYRLARGARRILEPSPEEPALALSAEDEDRLADELDRFDDT